MKTDRAALLWGTLIAVVFIAAVIVQPTEFPGLRLPFSVKHGEAFVAGGAFFFFLVASYRKLWKRAGFWVLLLAFLAVYWVAAVKIGENALGVRAAALYGVTAAAEGAVFGLLVARFYRRGPEVPSWLGLPR